jgi:hypothetical protein
MFVSLEAITGNYIDVYPESVQNVLNSLQINQTVFLGADCFNATVKRTGENEYIQWTPGVAQINKRKGQRSAMKITDQTHVTVYKWQNHWSFFGNGHENKRLHISQALRTTAPNAVWQWSYNTDRIFRIGENDWITYSQDACNKIESAFQNNQSVVSINVGMKDYNIFFLMDDEYHTSTFGKQCYNDKERWVRRAFRSSTSFDVPVNEDICALCLDKFDETLHIPWVKTSCNHVFHAVCLDRMADSRCPMCRTALH